MRLVRIRGFDSKLRVPLSDCPEVKVRVLPGVPKVRRAVVVDWSDRQPRFLIHNPSTVNALRAVTERVLYVQDAGRFVEPPAPHKDIYNRLSAFRMQVCKRIGYVEKLAYKDFVSLYVGPMRTRYQQAVDSLRRFPLNSSDARIRAFVKVEKVISASSWSYHTTSGTVNVEGKEDPAPRCISPRSPRYNVELGRYLRPLEHIIYKVIGQLFGGRTISKGRNAVQQAEDLMHCWKDFNDPVAIDLDASRFDQHVSIQALLYEHGFYKWVFGGDKFLTKLLRMQLRNKIKFSLKDGVIYLEVEGHRMSGDMNTGLGNCIIMCALVYTYLSERGIRARLYNNGDDCVVVMERKDMSKFLCGFSEWFRSFGFTMKIGNCVDTFEQIEFCQTKPVWNGQCYVMCRKYPLCVEKDQVSLLPIESEKSMLNYFHDLGNCGQALASGVPILGEFYAMYQRWGAGAKGFNRDARFNTGMEWLAKGLDQKYRKPDQRSRYSFFLAFGIPPALQEELEEKYRRALRPRFSTEYITRITLPAVHIPLP